MISVIVPVYKVEKYLSRCIDSIISQTYQEWELFLVDDGSPDRSGVICDEYSNKDSRIRVFHKKNGGVSSARNLALEYVCGDWVCFVDADDIIAPNTFELSLQNCEKNDLDIIQFSFTRTESFGLNNGVQTSPLVPSEYLQEHKFLVTVWGSLIKSSIIKSNNIQFDTKIKLAEDQMFIFECIMKSKKIQRIGDQLYFYRDNENGAVRNPKLQDCIDSMYALSRFGKENPLVLHYIEGTIMYLVNDLIRFRLLSSYRLASILSELNIKKPFSSRGLRIIAKSSRISKILCCFVIKYYVFKNSL